jgi:predicted site-specific integrase-resolvase
MEEMEDYELEEEQKSYPQYDNMSYHDLISNFDELTNRLQREVKYNSDPLVVTDLNSELSYVKKRMEERGTAQTTFIEGEEEELPQEYRDMLLRVDEITDRMERDVGKRIEELKANQKTFTEGDEGTVNITGPSGSTTVPSVDFVEDPNNLLPDVLDAFDESFNANWDDIEDRLSKLKKFSTAEKKRDFENQVERVQAVTRVIQTKEKVVLNPRNKYVRELIKRSSVRTLKDGTEVLMF